jgi:hypothetical protein
LSFVRDIETGKVLRPPLLGSQTGRAHRGGNTMRLIGALLAVAACLVLLVTGSAIADDEGGNSNASLKGKFRFSLNKSCTDTATGALVHIYFIGVTT